MGDAWMQMPTEHEQVAVIKEHRWHMLETVTARQAALCTLRKPKSLPKRAILCGVLSQ